MAIKFKIVPVTHYQQNCTVIWCERTREAAVVDPGGDVRFIPGHGEMSRFGDERKTNPFVADKNFG